MTHPSTEEWMSFLYGEVDKETRGQFDRHLGGCAECQALVSSWRGAMKDLDTFRLPGRQEQQVATTFTPAFVKWGIAAMFILGVGFGAGQLSKSANHDSRKLQVEVVSQVREQLREEFKADLQAALASTERNATNEFRRALRAAFTDWAATQTRTATAQTQELLAALTESMVSARAEDRQTTLALLKSLEQQNFTAFALLKKNLETVAVVADNRFQQTETQLGQLISYTQPNTE
jgi:pyruvate dehydrogenase complex dehydrogenase (E1) component